MTVIDKVLKLVSDPRNAAALLIVIGLTAWIRPEPPGLLALTLIVFAAVYLGAAAAKALRRPARAPDDGQAKP